MENAKATWSRSSTKIYVILCLSVLALVPLLTLLQNNSLFLEDADSRECFCDSSTSDDSVLFFIGKPVRNFHGNHWFHIGEYFIAQHNSFARRLQSNKVRLIMQKSTITEHLTPFTFFLIALSFLNNLDQSIDLHVIDGVRELRRMEVGQNKISPMKLKAPQFSFDGGLKILSADMNAIKEPECVCGYYGGAMGVFPTRSDLWFDGEADVAAWRSKLKNSCSTPYRSDATSTSNRDQRRLRMVIYQRDIDRILVNLHDVLERIFDNHSSNSPYRNKWEVEIFEHSDSMHPCSLYNSLYDADFFLTTHGFQSTGSHNELINFLRPKLIKPFCLSCHIHERRVCNHGNFPLQVLQRKLFPS